MIGSVRKQLVCRVCWRDRKYRVRKQASVQERFVDAEITPILRFQARVASTNPNQWHLLMNRAQSSNYLCKFFNAHVGLVKQGDLEWRVSLARRGCFDSAPDDSKHDDQHDDADRKRQPDRHSKTDRQRPAENGDDGDQECVRHLSAHMLNVIAAAGL